jgi:hypothetical protein
MPSNEPPAADTLEQAPADIPEPDPAMFEGELSAEARAAIDAVSDPPRATGKALAASAGVGTYAVAQARTQNGVSEPAAYEKYVRYFGVAGTPQWCAYFVSWCFDTCQVCDHDRQVPWGRYGSIGYTGTIYSWARDRDRLVPAPQHGDIYGRADQGHVGLVVGANPAGTEIYTINGNWSNAVGYASWTKRGSVWVTGGSTIGLWFARW